MSLFFTNSHISIKWLFYNFLWGDLMPEISLQINLIHKKDQVKYKYGGGAAAGVRDVNRVWRRRLGLPWRPAVILRHRAAGN